MLTWEGRGGWGCVGGCLLREQMEGVVDAEDEEWTGYGGG